MAQLTMYDAIANSPSTTLTSSINAIVTQIEVVDSSVFPTAPNLLVLGYNKENPETCLYTNIVGNTITIQRGVEGVAKDFDIDTKVARLFTAKDYNAMVSNIKDLSNSQIALSIALG